MANPMSIYTPTSPEQGVVDIYYEFNVTDASGTPGTVAAGTAAGGKEFGVTPVIRTGVGAYDILLREAWIRLLAADIFPVGPNSTTAGKDVEIVTDNVATVAAPKISILFTRRDTNAAADPANGDVVKIGLTLKCKLP